VTCVKSDLYEKWPYKKRPYKKWSYKKWLHKIRPYKKYYWSVYFTVGDYKKLSYFLLKPLCQNNLVIFLKIRILYLHCTVDLTFFYLNFCDIHVWTLGHIPYCILAIRVQSPSTYYQLRYSSRITVQQPFCFLWVLF
jgi:hypothetical protein